MDFHFTGFGYHFNSMTSSSDELNLAFQTIFRGALKPTIMTMLQGFVPPLRFIVSCRTPTVPYRGLNAENLGPRNRGNVIHLQLEQKMQRDKKFADARTVMRRIGARLVQERKLALSNGASEDDAGEDREYGKDLLSLLVKANNMSDPEAASMSDEDVQDRESASHSHLTPVPPPHSHTAAVALNTSFYPHTEIATFIVAGHETSSAGIAWCLHCLSNNVEAQGRLRDEILHLGTDSPDMEQMKSLKYLDYVVREGLRLYPPIPSTSRVAMKDDILPLSNGTGIRYDPITWPQLN